MTVSTTTNKVSYSCDGSTTVFPYTFPIFEDGDLTVILRDSDGAETTLTLTTDYTVSGAGDPGGGNVTTVNTYDSGYTLVIKRELDITQGIDYITGGAFPASSHENALDRLTMICQQLYEALQRAVKLAASSSYADIEVPDPEADKYLKWNAQGNLENAELVALGDMTVHDNAATPHQSGGWYADNDSTGPVLLATGAETAAMNDASKVVTPSGLASAIQCDVVHIPAGSLRPAQTNAGTQAIQEYPDSETTRDYIELGQDGDESVAYDITLWLPEQWDQSRLKMIFAVMPPFDTALNAGSAVKIGVQHKAYSAASDIDTNWSTPPVYITHVINNGATSVEEETSATDNIATGIAGSLNRIDIRITRDNTVPNNATGPVWITHILAQMQKSNAVTGW